MQRVVANGVRRFYEFGPFRLDPNRHRLLCGGKVIPLSSKAIETLTLLVQNRGKLLEREALMHALWPDVIVEDANLTVAISQLRKAINQNCDTGEFIQTIPRVGYRFVAELREVVEECAPLKIQESAATHTVVKNENGISEQDSAARIASLAPATRSTTAMPARKVFRIVATAAVLTAALTALIAYSLRPQRPQTVASLAKARALAVLPFQLAHSENTEEEYLGPGLADSLNMRLSRIRRFAVRPTSSVLKFNGPEQDALEAGRKLGVEDVVEGRIEHVSDRIRVTTRLWRVRDGMMLWGDSFDQPFTNLFAIEDQVSRQVAQALQRKLTGEEQQQLASKNTDSPEAFHAYLRGRYAWNKRTNEEIMKAIKFFQQAIDFDPAYAAAYAGLADCYLLLGDYDWGTPNENFPLARDAALRALEIDNGLAEAQATLAHAKFLFYHDFAGAEQEYLRAIELKPNYATVHHWYALFLAAMGRTDEAQREIQLAEDLDPLSPIIRANIGLIDYFARRYDGAIAQERKVLVADPDFVQARRKLAFALEARGAEQEAIVEWMTIERQLGTGDQTLEDYKKACAAAGLRGYWLQALEHDKKEVGKEAGALSSYYARLGDSAQAFYWLDRAYDQHAPWLVYSKVTPVYDNLRSDPRFKAFLQRLGL